MTVQAPRPGPALVLETKLHPPPARPGLVERGALLQRLLGADASVIVIGAPAGYGKTTLLAQYATATERPLAWLSLDAADGDPVVLAHGLATAIERVAAVDDRVLAALRSPAPAIERVVLPGLLNRLPAAGGVALALDDLHLVEDPAGLAVVAFLCDHLPPGSQLLIASRDTSALPLGRLRVSGRLLEVGWGDLALDPLEAQDLLRAAGAPHERRDLDEVIEHTEGWPAAVYLTALALRDDPGSAPAVAHGDRDLVGDLSGDLLARQPPERLSFLLQTSILDRLSAPLCDAVLGRRDSARQISELEHSNLFVQPLDRRREWYRYHHLFRDVLRSELARRDGGAPPALHGRASRWHELEGTPEEAMQHALAAGEMERAAELTVHSARGLVSTGRLATVRRWLDAFTERDVAGSAPLALTAAWAHALSGDRGRARRSLVLAEDAPWSGLGPNGEPSLEAALALIRAVFGWDGVSRMHADAVDAYRLLPTGHPAHEPAAVALGCSLVLLGRGPQAAGYLEEAAALGAARPVGTILALGMLARDAVESDRLDVAEAQAGEGLAIITDLGLADSTASAAVHTAVACLAVRRGDAPQARAHLERARSALPQVDAAPWRSIETRALLGRVALAIGDLPLAASLLEAARRELARYADAGVLPRLLAREERALEEARGRTGELGEPLTPAELRVLALLPTHLSSTEIGAALHISRNTVKAHSRAIYRKLDADGRSDAVERARRHGLIEPAG